MARGFATKRKAEEVEPPKKPQTGFFLFSNEKRKSLVNQAKFKTADGKQDTKAITAELGRLWKELDDKEKNKYNDKAAQLKEKYKLELEKFKKENPNYKAPKKSKKDKKGKKGKKSKKESTKRAESGYQLFCKEKRAEVNERPDVKREDSGKLDVTKVMKILSQMWTDLGAEGKQVYLDKAKKLKEEAEKEKATKSESESDSGSDSESDSDSD